MALLNACTQGVDMRIKFLCFIMCYAFLPVSFSDTGKGLPIMSFDIISSLAQDGQATEVNVSGYLSGFTYREKHYLYLCESMDACFFASPRRLEVSIANNEHGKYLELYDCHVILSGVMTSGPNSRETKRVIGEISKIHQVSLAVSRLDYSDYNPNCKAWENIIKVTEDRFPGNDFEKMMSDRAY